MCLAKGHNTVTTVRPEPATHRFRVKHSTTELLHSKYISFNFPCGSSLILVYTDCSIGKKVHKQKGEQMAIVQCCDL